MFIYKYICVCVCIYLYIYLFIPKTIMLNVSAALIVFTPIYFDV